MRAVRSIITHRESYGFRMSLDNDMVFDGDLASCCQETMSLHGTHNHMMMCPACKTVIKVFVEPKAFRAYLTFCRSRHRRVRTVQMGELMLITFSSYETIR